MDVVKELYVTVGGSREQGKGGAGTYHPAHRMGANDLSSHVTFSAYLNRSRLVNGEWKSDNQRIDMVAWSSKTSESAKAGDGFAEFCARHMAPGTSFMCLAELQYYMRKVKDTDGSFINGKDGKPIMAEATQWVVIPRSIDIKSIRFSPEQVIAEIAEYYRRLDAGQAVEGILDFKARPPRWNSTDPRDTVGQLQTTQWKGIDEYRRTIKYCGGREFGYFKCWLPDGAVLLNAPVGATIDHMVGTSVSLAKVEGYSYAEYLTNGWTNELMLASCGPQHKPDFSIFVQSGELKAPMAAPPGAISKPPAAPMAPPPPAPTPETPEENTANAGTGTDEVPF